MFGWSFAARTIDEIERLLRALGRHRYLLEADLRIHFSVDAALAPCGGVFASAAERFAELVREADDLELGSRDPRLWRALDADELCGALGRLWDPRPAGRQLRDGLSAVLRSAGVPRADHAAFAADDDEPPHPELVLLDWLLLPVDQLDSERHAGALRAMADSGDEVDPSAPVYVEGPTLAEPELTAGLPGGVLPHDPIFWADGPYSYCDYVFRGVTRAAKLVDPPVGYRDLDAL